jgi:hypothetical protein
MKIEREEKSIDKLLKLSALTNKKVRLLTNNEGKEMPMSHVSFNQQGKIIMRRPKEAVVKRVM